MLDVLAEFFFDGSRGLDGAGLLILNCFCMRLQSEPHGVLIFWSPKIYLNHRESFRFIIVRHKTRLRHYETARRRGMQFRKQVDRTGNSRGTTCIENAVIMRPEIEVSCYHLELR